MNTSSDENVSILYFVLQIIFSRLNFNTIHLQSTWEQMFREIERVDSKPKNWDERRNIEWWQGMYCTV